eukprot:4087601-Amphidinium_carterae.1
MAEMDDSDPSEDYWQQEPGMLIRLHVRPRKIEAPTGVRHTQLCRQDEWLTCHDDKYPINQPGENLHFYWTGSTEFTVAEGTAVAIRFTTQFTVAEGTAVAKRLTTPLVAEDNRTPHAVDDSESTNKFQTGQGTDFSHYAVTRGVCAKHIDSSILSTQGVDHLELNVFLADFWTTCQKQQYIIASLTRLQFSVLRKALWLAKSAQVKVFDAAYVRQSRV